MYATTHFGWKALHLYGFFGLALCLSMFSYSLSNNDNFLLKVVVIIYTIIFELTLGPVFWLYVAEFLIPTSMSLVTFINWFTIVAISIATPYMLTWSPPHTFKFYAICCVVGGIYSAIFLWETKGLTKEQVSKLYAPVDAEEGTEMVKR